MAQCQGSRGTGFRHTIRDVFRTGDAARCVNSGTGGHHQSSPDFIGADLYQPQVGLSDTWFYSDNAKMTPLRKQYIEMRDASNSAYETRDTFLSAALLLRVVSVLQMVYLEGFVGRRYDAPDEAQLSLSTPQASWSAKAAATGSGVVAWRMTW